MTFILDMVSGQECESETLYSKAGQLHSDEQRHNALHMDCPNLQLALAESGTPAKQTSIVAAGLDIAELLKSAD
jgi:hypothetical protein